MVLQLPARVRSGWGPCEEVWPVCVNTSSGEEKAFSLTPFLEVLRMSLRPD